MNIRYLFFLVIWLFINPTHAGTDSRLKAKHVELLAPASQAIEQADSFTLYEGLPHQTNEQELLKQELATKKTIRLHNFPFYERPLNVSASDVELLRKLSANKAGYHSYSGPKLCGEFHPDYCIVWKKGEAVYHLLICLGCHEIEFFGRDLNLKLDMPSDTYKEFGDILKKYRDQRPNSD